MKLQNWFRLIALPPLGLLLVLLAATLDSAHGFLRRVQKLRSDSEALLVLHRFTISLDDRIQSTAFTLAELELGSRSPADSARDRLLINERLAGENPRLFATLATTLQGVEDNKPNEDNAALIARADMLYRAIVARTHEALTLAYRGQLQNAEATLRSAVELRADSTMSRIERRLRHEERQLEDGILILSMQDSRLARAAIGRGPANDIAKIAAEQSRLTAAVNATSAFHDLVVHVLQADAVDAVDEHAQVHRELAERAASTMAALVAEYDSSAVPLTVQHANATLALTLALGDSIQGATETKATDPASRAALRRHLHSLSVANTSAIDSLPESSLTNLHAALDALGRRASTLRALLVLFALLSVSIVLGASALMSRLVIRPVEALTRAASRVASGQFELSAVEPGRGVGEVKELERTFARMTKQLSAFASAQRTNERALHAGAGKQRALAERLGHLLASGPAVVYTLTVDARPRHTFISENVLEQTGYSADAFLSDPNMWISLIHPDDRPALTDGLGGALTDGVDSQNYRMRHADGDYRWVHGQIRVMHDDAGVPREFVGWWMDVTDARRSAEVQRAAPQAAKVASRAKADMPGALRVLLAEDNPVNQRLATRLLERRQAEVTVATNGREAVAAWAFASFDVILMDVQMPELDGIEAARMIRLRENGTDHVPIIALTASATADDRHRCLAAGMDAFIAKPFRAAEFLATIDRLGRGAGVCPGTARAMCPTAPLALNFDVLHRNTNNDDALAQELLAIFRTDAPRYAEHIAAAATAGDATDLQHWAHALRGAANAIGADAIVETARNLEESAVSNIAGARASVTMLNARITAFDAAMASSAPARLPTLR